MLQEVESDSYGPFSDADEPNDHDGAADGTLIAAPIQQAAGNVSLFYTMPL